ncbi:hypothetical protein GGR22_000572 [Flavobacterium gossypii]|uniref:Uncharacterized protein n=1 Tax=Flavobacterium gossypii TaxID=1646119 RepID=A0ABR6DL93_9FLAO|nr:hypothetical protein [Flavobacterium gossypii]MBA9072446.1 hypothetical protein [Flavobacterium gossypii]
MNKKVQIVEETIRISFLADNELEEFDIFVIRYKEYDAVRSMVIIENKYFDNILIYDAAFVDYPTAKPDIQIHEIESPIYVANKVRFSSSCYKRCASELMNNLPLWHVGIIGTFCTPCGVAAGVYAAAGILGCTGGCFVTVWEK